MARVVQFDTGARESTGKDEDQKAAEEQNALYYYHALLEDHLVGQRAQPTAHGEDFALALVPVRFQSDDGALPHLVVLYPQITQLGEDSLVQSIEKQVNLSNLTALELGQRLLQELGL